MRSAATLPGPRPAAVPSVPGIPDGRPVVAVPRRARGRARTRSTWCRCSQRVRDQVPDAFLAVAGEGPLADELAGGGRCGRARPATSRCSGSSKPVEPLLWRADALVLLSNAEGLPQVLIQAAAAGLPFVTYDVDGGREVVALGAVGQVVPLGDVAGAADALMRLLAGAGAASAARRRLVVGPDVIAASYRSVVDDILGESRRAG